jgi:hypothetical protein
MAERRMAPDHPEVAKRGPFGSKAGMFKPVLASLIALVALPQTVLAAPPQVRKSLEKLEASTRMSEVCDMEAAAKISASTGFKGVDRVVADARAETRISGNTVSAPGAAFRNKAGWHGFSYTCTLAPDHLSAKSIKFIIGNEIPKSRWEEYGLWQ